MFRSATAALTVWIAMAAVATAQTTTQFTTVVPGKAKPQSPYRPTGNFVEWSGEVSELPPEMPTVVVPRPTIARPVSKLGVEPFTLPTITSPSLSSNPTPIQTPTLAPAPAPTATPIAMPQGPPATSSNPPSTPWSSAGMPFGNSFQSGCCDGACSSCTECGPDRRFWFGGEYLLWTTRSMGLPAVVTSSPVGTPRATAGVLGEPQTAIVYGGQNVDGDFRSGIRVFSGFWLDDDRTIGLESSTLYLQPSGEGGSFRSFNNDAIYARPFLNADPAVNRPDSQIAVYPNTIAGEVAVNSRTKFWGTDAMIRANIARLGSIRVDALGGFRYLQLQDTVTIRENLVVLDPNSGLPVGTNIQVYDNFYSNNVFNGGAIGASAEVRSGRWFATGRSTVSLGSTYKQIQIAGANQIGVPAGVPITTLGGVLTQPTNIGKYSSTAFAVVPEASLAVGYQLSDMLRAYVGYTFLYMSNVARAGDQLDLTVNGSQFNGGQLVGQPRPIFARNDTDFWAQGITFGAEIRY